MTRKSRKLRSSFFEVDYCALLRLPVLHRAVVLVFRRTIYYECNQYASQRASEADVRAMRGMRGRRASHARHARQTYEPCEACEADVRGMRAIDQNIMTFFVAILNTE